MAKPLKAWIKDALKEGYTDDEVYSHLQEKFGLSEDDVWEKSKAGVTIEALRAGKDKEVKPEPEPEPQPEVLQSQEPEPEPGPQRPGYEVPARTEGGDIVLGGQSTGVNIPLSMMRREDVQQVMDYAARPVKEGSIEGAIDLLKGGTPKQAEGVGMSLSPGAHIADTMQAAAASAITDVPEQRMTPGEEKHEASRGAVTSEELDAMTLGRAASLKVRDPAFGGASLINRAIQTRRTATQLPKEEGEREKLAASLERQPDESLIEYGRRIRNFPNLAKKVLEDAKRYEDLDAWRKVGGATGTLTRAGGALAGAVGETAKMVGTEGTFLLFSSLGPALSKSANENLEKTYNDLRNTYSKMARARGGQAYFEVYEDTLNAMEDITKKRMGRMGGSGFWRNVYEDLGENIGALGELAAIFGPSAIDVLRDLETGSTGVKLEKDANFAQKAAAWFQYGIGQGEALPGAMAGGMVHIIMNPLRSLKAQPITALTTLLPLYRMLQAAGSASAGKMISVLNKAADAEGIDLNKLPQLKFNEKTRQQIIRQMRDRMRTDWGKAVESRLGQWFLEQDYITEAAAAAARGEKLPNIRWRSDLTSPQTAAKLAALTYVVSEEDASDVLTALVPGAMGVAHMAQLRKIKGAKGAAKYQSRKPVARAEAAMGRIFSDIARMTDPEGTAKASAWLQLMRDSVNRGESDWIDIRNSVKSDSILADNSAVLAQALERRDALLAKVDGHPEIKALEEKWLAAEEAAKKGSDRFSGDKVKAAEDARNAYREARADMFVAEADNAIFVADEVGAQKAYADLEIKKAATQERHAQELAEMDAKHAARLEEAEVTETDKVAKLDKGKVVGRRFDEVAKTGDGVEGKRFGKWGQSVEGNVKFLDELLVASRSKTKTDLDDVVDASRARIVALQKKFATKGSTKGGVVGLTDAQRKILADITDEQLQLLDDYDAIKRVGGDADAAIVESRQRFIDHLEQKRAAAASELEASIKGTRQTLEAELAESPLTKRQKLEARQAQDRADKIKAQEEAIEAIDADIDTQSRLNKAHYTAAVESVMGDTRFAGKHVRLQSNDVVYAGADEARQAGLGKTGTFTYLDADQGKVWDETGVLPEGTNVVAPAKGARTEIGLPFASKIQAIMAFSPEEASTGLKALYRVSKDLAESEFGFFRNIESLGGRTAGAGAGINLTMRYYLETIGGLLYDNGSANLLRAPKLRKKFSQYLHKKLIDNDALTNSGVFDKTSLTAVEKLVNDFAFGRTRGNEFIQMDPVFQLASQPGQPPKKMPMSELFGSFLADQGERNLPKLYRESRQDAVTAMSQQLVAKLEESTMARELYKDIGTAGWFEDGLNPTYLAELVESNYNNGRLPFVLKDDFTAIGDALLPTRERLAGTGQAGAAPDAAVVTEVARRLGKSYEEAAQLVRETAARVTQSGDRYILWQKNNLPSLEQQHAPALANAEMSAGINASKRPVAVEDMAGFQKALGDLGFTYVDSEFGGTLNSTIGWAFMSTRMMNSDNGLGLMRSLSSAIKRNLTTQRPQTALTNLMSNVMAKMTRDGTLPPQVFRELAENADLWRKFTQDPDSIPIVERGRLKAIFDEGIRSSNMLNAEANLALDAYFSNPASRAADAAINSFRRMPVVGDITKLADFVYQAGDAIFKLSDARRMLRRFDMDVTRLENNSSYSFRDISQNNKLLGTVVKEADGKMYVRVGRKRYDGDAAIDKLEDLKLKASVGYSNALYFDYANVPGYIHLARNFDGLLFGPFKTWAWKSLDIPFIKKGMGYHSVFGNMPGVSTDPVVAANMYARQTVADIRRAGILLAARANDGEGESALKQLMPEWVAMSSWLEPGSYVAGSMGTRNYTIGLSNFIEFLYKQTRSGYEDEVAKMIRKERPGHREIARLLYDSGMVTGLLGDLVTGEDRYGNPLPQENWFPVVAQRMMPGWIYTGIDSVSTVMDEGETYWKYFSTYDRAASQNPNVRYDIASHLVRIWTGRRLQELDPKAAVRVLKTMKTRLKKKPKQLIEEEHQILLKKYGEGNPEVDRLLAKFEASIEQRNEQLVPIFVKEIERLGDAISAKSEDVGEAEARLETDAAKLVPPFEQEIERYHRRSRGVPANKPEAEQ
tara:strand:- start:628 stop:6975 length:6348 start_codon:yes stop_codon:yes gene_type:complete